MTTADIESLRQQIASAIHRTLPGNFSDAIVTARMIAQYCDLQEKRLATGNSDAASVLSSQSVESLLKELRIAMANAAPGKRAWYTAVVILMDGGRFRFTFDDDQRPDFDYSPGKDQWNEGQRMVPR